MALRAESCVRIIIMCHNVSYFINLKNLEATQSCQNVSKSQHKMLFSLILDMSENKSRPYFSLNWLNVQLKILKHLRYHSL